MKKEFRNCILYVFFIGFSFANSQSIRDIFPDFDKRGMKTSILYNPAGISNIIKLKDKKHSIGDFYQTYKSISFSVPFFTYYSSWNLIRFEFLLSSG